jgi:hypothetical protein
MTINVSTSTITFPDTTLQTTAATVFSSIKAQVFNYSASTQYFTIPAGITALKVTVVGSGAGGGAGSGTTGNTYGGGGAAAAAISYLTGLTPGNTIAVNVPQGGTGAAIPGSATTVSSGTQAITTITATGGTRGYSTGGGANAAISTGGTINMQGGSSDSTSNGNGVYNTTCGGFGGNSIFGGGGNNGGSGGIAAAATAPGAGAGSGIAGFTLSGIKGGDGIVIFEW